ncbi:MAG: chromate transporter [Clostridia bacterium]|nr:chromate transporter [Clostridia bacterium]
MKNKDRLLTLFLTFLKIGAFTFGGGYAMIPLIQKEVTENHKWLSDEDILNIVAIAESTPGPIAINSATFVGYMTCGVVGSVLATLGVVLPAFIFIALISLLLQNIMDIQAVQYAFMGIRAGVLALVIKALISMYKQCPKNLVAYIIAGLAFAVTLLTDISILYVIIACAVIGLVTSMVMKKKEAEAK